jgi:hypothetical protein
VVAPYATVIEGPKQPTELCLGGVASSLPPQCGGPRLKNFDWDEHRGEFEEASGVRWGEFAVTGRFDGTTFTATKVTKPARPDPQSDSTEFRTPCPEPPGGWRVLDPAKTTEDTMSATFEAASRLPGYADSWIDSSRDTGLTMDESSVQDPRKATINVRVTRDVAGAERILRRHWGGALCVTKAEHTDKELRAVQDRLTKLPGMLSVGATLGAVEVEVVYDDGTFQRWADATFGPGLVRISSVLVPVSAGASPDETVSGGLSRGELVRARELVADELRQVRGTFLGATAFASEPDVDSRCPRGRVVTVRVVWKADAAFTHSSLPGGPPDGPQKAALTSFVPGTGKVCEAGAMYRDVGPAPGETLVAGTRVTPLVPASG